MTLEQLFLENTDDVEFLKKIFLSSFPREERRPLSILFHLYETNEHFKIDIIKFEGKTVGFLCYWDLEKFVFGEYFAISPDFRNGGYGKEAFLQFVSNISKPVLIEVELPDTDIAKRRIGFYERLEFKGWDKIKYEQPAHHKDSAPVPLMLMSRGDIDVERDIYQIVDVLYSAVYDVKGK